MKVVILLISASFVLADKPTDEAVKAAKSLQGVWEITKAEAAEEEMKLQNAKFTIEGDSFKLGKYTFKIDPTKEPKCIDFYLGDKLISKGIFSQVDQELRICRAVPTSVAVQPKMSSASSSRPANGRPSLIPARDCF